MSDAKQPDKKIGEILLDEGLFNPTQLQEALDYGKKENLEIRDSLQKLGLADESMIAKGLAKKLKLPYVNLDDVIVDPEAVLLIPERVARKHKVLALALRPEELLVAFVNPQDNAAKEEVAAAISARLVPCVAEESKVKAAIDRYYPARRPTAQQKGAAAPAAAGAAPAGEAGTDSIAVNAVNNILLQAVRDGASDIHIEPLPDKVRVRCRIDGILQNVQEVATDMHPSIVSRIKILAGLDIGDRRKPQDGRFGVPVAGRDFDMRVSTLPMKDGEKVVIRLLDKSKIKIDLGQLHMQEKEETLFKDHLTHPHEIILVTGPTGSGKTTTLYAALNHINTSDKNIITVEDPVEYDLYGIGQVQVNVKADLTFASALRSILRQDPDVVMIGEIRDVETAEIAIQAALTGHLVLSTLHTNDAPSAVTRLIDMDIPPFLIASSVGLVLAQRLIRKLCPACKTPFPPPDSLRRDLDLPESGDLHLFQPNGCPECKGTGYQGRMGIYELLAISTAMEKLILAKSSSRELARQAEAEGVASLRSAGIRQLLDGATSVEEILRVTID